ncbi:MAG: tRNA (adenosine(37)-N6)-threonylcarbamoyltransferase complex dimerization subunit type 1 TsaB [Synergistaceae bacterium]|nr:tRNA (adenosine(37)-N6)-threonylcarbamoyltransferase complex dimerization subunit type 1 TsaB [Synergistaceae bacterium]
MGKLILALDCSLRLTNVAVFLDGGVLISESLDLGRRQAAELPVIVKNAFSDAGRSFDQVGLLAVTNGPGYFTGIRVGVSYAAALAYGLGVKVAPVSSLHMLAGSSAERTPVLAAVYAGRERVYAASFGCEDGLPVGEYGKDEIERWLLGHENAEVISDAPEKTFLPDLGLGRKVSPVRPDASEAARIAWLNPASAVHPMELRVSYHRSPLT